MSLSLGLGLALTRNKGVGGLQGRLNRLPTLFAGTGRVALTCIGVNRVASGGAGSYSNTNNGNRGFSRRAGFPYFLFLRELIANVWLAYEAAYSNTGGTNGVNQVSSMGLYKPMKTVPVTDAAWSDGDGGAVAYPTNAAALWVECNLGSKSSAITRVALRAGLGASNSGVMIISMTDGAAAAVVPTLLPTAAQAVARGQLAAGAIVSGGGSIPDAAYVMGTNAADNARGGAINGCTVPIYDGPAVDGLKVRATWTGVAGKGGGTVDRAYVAEALYGTESMSDTDTGADLHFMGYVSSWTDGSANDTAVLSVRATGSGNPFVQMGGGHGNEIQTAITTYVDDVAVVLTAPTTTRQSSGTTKTLKIPGHGLQVGDKFSVSLVGSASYNGAGFTVSSIVGDYVTYTDIYGTSLTESETADTAGRYMADKIVKGTSAGAQRTSYFVHPNYGGGTTNICDHVANYRLTTGLSVYGVLTPAISLDSNNGTYFGLMTVWGGKNTEYGPEYQPIKTFQCLDDPTLKQQFTADNDSSQWPGQHRGFVAYEAGTGQAAAVVQNNESAYPTWNAGNAFNFIQDRTGGSVEKFYWRWTPSTSEALVLPSYSYNMTRYDKKFAPGFSDPLLPVL